MAVATTVTVENFSGQLATKSNNNTKFLDAIFARGKKGNAGIGRRKVTDIEFSVSSDYVVGGGTQPSISENDAIAGVAAKTHTRTQTKNNIQIYQSSVDVSFLKSSATGRMAGLNTAGQTNNVPNELDFQKVITLKEMKKDMNYTYLNGVQVSSTSDATAWKSSGILPAIKSNVLATAGALTADKVNQVISAAFEKGFEFNDGRMELWCNPADLTTIDNAYSALPGYNQTATRTEGGFTVKKIMTQFGELTVEYDAMIPKNTLIIVNFDELEVAELDVPEKGSAIFYEDIAKDGASKGGQLYAQTGPDYGAEQKHIKINITAAA